MADTPAGSGLTVQQLLDAANSIREALVTPAVLGVGGLALSVYRCRAWLRGRREEIAARAEAAERARQDLVDAAQIGRLTDEIARKDRRVAELELQARVLDETLRQVRDYVGAIRHELRNRDTEIVGLAIKAGLPERERRVLPPMPDFDAQAARLLPPP